MRAVGADKVRAEHQHSGVGVLRADHRRDVSQRGVVRRIVVQHDDLEIDAVLVSLVDHVEQRRRDGLGRADVPGAYLLLDDRQTLVGLGRRIDTDGDADLARDIERCVRGGHGWNRTA